MSSAVTRRAELVLGLVLATTTSATPVLGDQGAAKTPAARPEAEASTLDAEAVARIKRLKGTRPFWGWIANPNGIEINIILDKATANLQLARTGLVSFSWTTGSLQPQSLAERERALDEALAMLRHARRLDGKNRRVLAAIADVALERGATAVALEALQRLADLPPAKNEPPFARHTLLGTVLAQMNRWDEAADALSHSLSQATFAPDRRRTTWRLAFVEMERGNLESAIELLTSSSHNYDAATQLALAVAYDRSEQEHQASAILAKLKSSQALGAALANPHGPHPVRFTPAIDAHYVAALALEADGHLAEARSRWQSYAAAVPAGRYRARALQHIADIDDLAMAPRRKPTPTSRRKRPKQ